MWGKSAGCFFALLLLWGMVLWLPLGLLSRLHTMPYIAFYGLGCVLLPLLFFAANLVELRLRSKVLIRTGLGTVAVLVAFVILVVNFRNYLGVVIGTWHILADLYWLVCDDI